VGRCGRASTGKFDDRGKLLLQLLHCWVWPNLLFWSLVPNHKRALCVALSPGLMALGAIGLFGSWPALRSEDSASRLIVMVVGFLVMWLAVKIVFVEVVVPSRTAGRDAEATAPQLRDLVAAGRNPAPLQVEG